MSTMALVIGSAYLNDDDFLAALLSCELPASSFRHGDHLRLAWLQLHRHPFAEALAVVREDIRRFAARHGMPDRFHETITTAWVMLLATHKEPSFEDFVRENEYRLNLELLYHFWTPDLLASDAARSHWVPPDVESLPS